MRFELSVDELMAELAGDFSLLQRVVSCGPMTVATPAPVVQTEKQQSEDGDSDLAALNALMASLAVGSVLFEKSKRQSEE